MYKKACARWTVCSVCVRILYTLCIQRERARDSKSDPNRNEGNKKIHTQPRNTFYTLWLTHTGESNVNIRKPSSSKAELPASSELRHNKLFLCLRHENSILFFYTSEASRAYCVFFSSFSLVFRWSSQNLISFCLFRMNWKPKKN